MKKGVLIYPCKEGEIFNIGDYVQSIAARQFIGIPDIFIDREHLNYPLDTSVGLIANGWYMHHPENWPPNENIYPLFVALHINKLAEKSLLSPESIIYLKQFQPIGCRDYHTVRILKEVGIEAYFSGCLTLTLGITYQRTSPSDTVYFTDLNPDIRKNIRFLAKCAWNYISKYSLIKQIQKQMKRCGIQRSMKFSVALYSTYSNVIDDALFLQAVYKKQEIENNFNSEEEKFSYADSLLREYAKAKFVITSRIHCALPCLAIGTPVLYVDNQNLSEIHNCRLDGLRQLFHKIIIRSNHITCELKKNNEKIDSNFSFSNKKDYMPLANQLTDKCRKFADILNRK